MISLLNKTNYVWSLLLQLTGCDAYSEQIPMTWTDAEIEEQRGQRIQDPNQNRLLSQLPPTETPGVDCVDIIMINHSST